MEVLRKLWWEERMDSSQERKSSYYFYPSLPIHNPGARLLCCHKPWALIAAVECQQYHVLSQPQSYHG